MKRNDKNEKDFEVIIVGAGSAGLGVGVVLKNLGVNYIILEKDEVASSFLKWPRESRLISPSFTGNFFNIPDLNSITPDTSPAFSLGSEHPTGKEYARYLKNISNHFDLNIETSVNVQSVSKVGDIFTLRTSKNDYKCKYLIWAAGEYQYPKKNSFEGDELCLHFSEINSFSELEGDERIIIGGYESGFDAAINLMKAGNEVILIDSSDNLERIGSDSSYTLSPFTRDRIKQTNYDFNYYEDTRVEIVYHDGDFYTVVTSDGEPIVSKNAPINCTGFDTSIILVKDLFDHDDGYPLLNEYDESTKTKNLFLVGPQVKHANALFCFIYKYRQRFAIVAEEIGNREKINSDSFGELIEKYKNSNFYMKDLSCCEDECTC